MLKKKYITGLMFLFALITVCLPIKDVFAASKINIYNYTTKKTVSYTDKQIKYEIDKNSINMKNTPGILVNGYSFASYQDVFVNSAMKMSAKYDASKGTLTLSKYNTTIVLTVGSKNAKVNGKTITLSAAPIKVKFKEAAVTKILVPTRFVAETFGYKYVWNSSTATASMTSPRYLNYNNKSLAYTSTSGNVTIDGKSVDLGDMQSIIVNSTALVLAKKVFSDSSINADYTYDKNNKTVTLKKDSTVVVLTIGKTTATVNGKAKVMDTAPLIVKNLNTGKSYIMVPGSFIASYLGYNYSWNSAAKTSIITKKTNGGDKNLSGNEQNNTENQVLGSIPSLDTIAFNWSIQSNYLNEFNSVNSISNSAQLSNNTKMVTNVKSVYLDKVDVTGNEVYSIHSSTPFGNTAAVLKDNILNLHLSNAITSNSNNNFNNGLVQSVTTAYDSAKITSDINFYLNTSGIKYLLTLSDDKCTLYVTIYPNYISNISAGTKSGKDYLIITSTNSLKANLVDNGTSLSLQIPNTVNAVGGNYIDTSYMTYLKSVQLSNSGNLINITIGKSSTAKYSVAQNNTAYIICLSDSGTSDIGGNENTAGSGETGLQIKLPDGVNFSDIQDVDRYYDNEIAIILPGDYSDFYNNNPVSVLSSVVTNTSVGNNDDGMTEITISTSRLQGYKLTENNGSIDVTLGEPRDIYKSIVVLDPGHGGDAPGAMRSLNGVMVYEKDVNLAILYEKGNKYFNSKDSKIKVYYTRQDDSSVSLTDRAVFADKVGADIFVSLHMNTSTNTTVKGTDVYYSTVNTSVADSGLTSKNLAEFLINYLPDEVGTVKRSAINSKLAVNKNNVVPASLIELTFMSTKSELSRIVDEDFQDNTARAIYDALCALFEEYPTGR